MGQITPNIGIYIPAAGETNYDASFAAGMVNIDQHDHSGGPNKGVPIGTSGFDDDSVTYPKLNANVADNTTGIGTDGADGSNQLSILGILKSIFQIAFGTNGILVKNGSTALTRTITGTPGQVNVANGDGVSGNPAISLDASKNRTITGTANQIAVADGDGVSGNPTISFSPIVLNATQPAFLASVGSIQSNKTGDDTVYQVLFPTVGFDQNTDYDNTTSTFTAPVSGIYNIGFNLNITGINSGGNTDNFTQIDFYKNGSLAYTGFYGNTYALAPVSQVEISANQLMKLVANDTVTIVLTMDQIGGGGAKTANVAGGNFTGVLVT